MYSLFGLVVVVADARAQAQRPQRGDVALDVLAGDRGLEVVHVLLDLRLADVSDGAGAGALLPQVGVAHFSRRHKAGAHRAAGAGEPEAGGEEAGEVATVALCRACALRRACWGLRDVGKPVTRSCR